MTRPVPFDLTFTTAVFGLSLVFATLQGAPAMASAEGQLANIAIPVQQTLDPVAFEVCAPEGQGATEKCEALGAPAAYGAGRAPAGHRAGVRFVWIGRQSRRAVRSQHHRANQGCRGGAHDPRGGSDRHLRWEDPAHAHAGVRGRQFIGDDRSDRHFRVQWPFLPFDVLGSAGQALAVRQRSHSFGGGSRAALIRAPAADPRSGLVGLRGRSRCESCRG